MLHFTVIQSQNTQYIEKINEFGEMHSEVEKNRSLLFFKINLIKNKRNLNIDRTVYRKPIRSNNTIPYNSSPPFLYKIAANKFYIGRAFKICSDNFFLRA